MSVNLEEPVGWQAYTYDQTPKARDRVGCVVYSTLRRKAIPGQAVWTPAERRVLTSTMPKRFIHTTFRDVPPDGDQPPASRPLLVQAVHRALYEKAPLILEADRDINPGSLAAVCRFAGNLELPVYFATKSQTVPSSRQKVQAWTRASAFSEATVAGWVDGLRDALGLRIVRGVDSTHGGPHARRTFSAAADAAAERERAGWTQGEIREFLTLYGYTNGLGTVGAWHHARYQELLDAMRVRGQK